jgi:hypothetical protein
MATVKLNDILSLKSNLAPSQLEVLAFPNHNYKLVREFLTRDLKKADNGKEVGSANYISYSPKVFFKAKALTSTSYLPKFSSSGMEYIRPQVFESYNLMKGDVLISKDSNIGEIVILDRDYPDHMPSGALYRLPLEENKYYVLAFMKSRIVKDQLDTMVPKGATIRHAKTMFLDCKIPLPNQPDADAVIEYVENLTKLIIDKEIEIQSKKALIEKLIESELSLSEGAGFSARTTTFKDLFKEKRLDTGLYGSEYQRVYHMITSYAHGSSSLKELGYSIVRGQNLQISNIGRSIYRTTPYPNFYKLILSKDFTDWMTYERNTYIGNAHDLRTLKKGDVIFSCRGDLGRVVMVCEDEDNCITNIDNVHIRNESADMTDNIFIGAFFLYLRDLGILSKIAITGSGADSFTKYQFDYIKVPNFSGELKERIAKLFYNPSSYPNGEGNVVESHDKWNKTAGIYDIDKSVKAIKAHLNEALEKITNSDPVEISYTF